MKLAGIFVTVFIPGSCMLQPCLQHSQGCNALPADTSGIATAGFGVALMLLIMLNKSET